MYQHVQEGVLGAVELGGKLLGSVWVLGVLLGRVKVGEGGDS